MVTVMLCYARSGGTVLNQCLGSLPDTVVISEVNPLGGGSGARDQKPSRTVREQALNWYGIELRTENFADCVVELEKHCIANGKKKLPSQQQNYLQSSRHRIAGSFI